MKILRTLFCFIVGLSFVVAVGLYCARSTAPKVVYIQKLEIPSIKEIQRRLKELDKPRYDPGKLDGIVGKQTQTAWNNYECDRQAKKCFEIQKIKGN